MEGLVITGGGVSPQQKISSSTYGCRLQSDSDLFVVSLRGGGGIVGVGWVLLKNFSLRAMATTIAFPRWGCLRRLTISVAILANVVRS